MYFAGCPVSGKLVSRAILYRKRLFGFKNKNKKIIM